MYFIFCGNNVNLLNVDIGRVYWGKYENISEQRKIVFFFVLVCFFFFINFYISLQRKDEKRV